ncbi:NAD(P)H-dependent oxidoreductase [Novosphingobium mangrovi (ex Huang et al. 2023)]|uniref:NAD(P)H-dependent oxidoreductase n=1 Tax=Novosphingobium mangrovi (ex Huang et al. 2023) TaxID=2976432 RepID=A0ABT2I666_9SPHN|nr:NAD(P)H-dependent oxidoreductase [Novosphingobium mangrovi (ex Huang et al. 2023)]MCT2400307.1 NAD(P)H-dependent oxidoreductase [Novosphingobium mangrovi (ex Huang et al. 2023)]
MTRVLILDGHPDNGPHFIHAAADAYAAGAKAGGHEVRRIDVAVLNFPLIRSEQQYYGPDLPDDIAEAQQALLWAEHIVLLYPLWLGEVPAFFKAFLEQVARPDFAFAPNKRGFPKGMLAGRSARVIVTMGMPAPVYSLYYRAHSVKSFKRNILELVGIHPVRYAIIGSVSGSERHRTRWLARLRRWGEQTR